MAKNATHLTPVTTPAAVPARLPVAATALAELGIDAGTWAVLTDSIFPSAKTPEGVMLAVRYCQARNLDVMKRPVHVVPMWSKALKREVETVWPGIAEVQITAARTGLWAGMDPPKFGPDRTRIFEGMAYEDGRQVQRKVEVTYPEWVEVTVYRLVAGVRCPFSETVFWEETYSRAGRSELPNEMWQKRPRGQLLKCAKAASLRAAFPEEAGEYTAEEMAGKVIEVDAVPTVSTAASPSVADAQAKARPVAAALPASPAGVAEPEPEPPSAIPATEAARDAAIDAQVRAKIEQLVERACTTKAWGQAEDYARSRLTGEHLALALKLLTEAAEASVREAQAQAKAA